MRRGGYSRYESAAVKDLNRALKNVTGAEKAVNQGDAKLTLNYLKTIAWNVNEANKRVTEVGQDLKPE